MRRDLLGNLQTAAIPEVRGNSRRPERVISDLRMDAGALSSPPDHPVGIRLAQRPSCERIGFPDRRAEQRPLRIRFEIDALPIKPGRWYRRNCRHNHMLDAMLRLSHPATDCSSKSVLKLAR